MKLRKYYIPVLFLLLSFSNAFAQNEQDVLRYSNLSIVGTARSLAMGGAFSAVGADFSASVLNPAGLALYRKSELTFTPSLRFTNNESTYLDQNSKELLTRFNFQNMGYVHSGKVKTYYEGKRVEAEKGLISYSYSIGFNRIANFDRDTEISAYNPNNSITDYFSNISQGLLASELAGDNSFQGLAYEAFLINPDTNGIGGQWIPAVKGGDVQQTIMISERGRINDWSVGLAGNIQDVVYIGVTLAIQDLKYEHRMDYREDDVNNVHNADVADSTSFSHLIFNNYYNTKGSGFNARFGIIVRPADFIRIGASIQTPTWYNLTDNFVAYLSGHFDDDPNTYQLPDDQNPEGQFEYNMTMPYKFTTGIMVMLQKRGFITADLEITDHSMAGLSDNDSPLSGLGSFDQTNINIQDWFKFAYNYRFGGEFRLEKIRLRAGYANFGSVLKKENLIYLSYESGEPVEINGNRRLYTGGFGFKADKYYIDFAYVHEVSEDRRLFYPLDDIQQFEPELVNKKKNNSYLMTIGFTF